MSKTELAQQLGVSKRTIDRMRQQGKLHGVRLGTGELQPRIVFDLKRVRADLARLTEK